MLQCSKIHAEHPVTGVRLRIATYGIQADGPNQRGKGTDDMSDRKKITDTIETIQGTSAAKLSDGMAQASAGLEETQAKLKDGMDKAMRTAEEMVAFSQGNIEALTRFTQIWTAGVQDITKQLAATAQASFEETVTVLKSLGTVKSLKEAIDLQSSLTRSALEKAMTQSGKLTDASLKLTEQAMAPLTERMNLAVQKFGKAA